MDPDSCFEELRPILDRVAQAVRTAPLSPNGRAGLAVLVATHAFGLAGSLLDKDIVTGSREVADLIVGAMRTQQPSLQVVSERRE